MSPRLDEARTPDASSACPQGPTNSDSPAASAVPGPRAGSAGTTPDSSGEGLEGLEGLPEIPPYA
ncbi:RNA polymerase sigma factor SigF, partial [Streptomyces sp. SID8455]|nr:RNA polymerase sigma factor SigF [Streptomyces sp. SID8455]